MPSTRTPDDDRRDDPQASSRCAGSWRASGARLGAVGLVRRSRRTSARLHSARAGADGRAAVQRLAHRGDPVEERALLAQLVGALGASASAPSRIGTISRMRPGRGDMTTTRSERNTASGIEWVTNTTAAPVSAEMRTSSVCICSRVISSSAPNGSSMSSSRGCSASDAGDRDALLHAAGELVGVAVGEVGEADELEQLGDRASRGRPDADAVQLERQRDVRGDRAPRQQAGLLERDAVVLVEARLRRGLAEDRDGAGRWARRGRRSSRRSVDLPQPLGPMSETNSPARDREVDRVERLHLAGAGREHLVDAAHLDGGDRGAVAAVGAWLGARSCGLLRRR